MVMGSGLMNVLICYPEASTTEKPGVEKLCTAICAGARR